MLTPEQIAALRDAAGRIADPINNFLIEDIARRVSEAGQLTSTAEYQVWKAQNLGLSQQEIKKRLSDLLKLSDKEIEKLMTQAAEVGYDFDLSNLPTADAIPFSENASIQQMVSAAVKLAQDDFTNLTQTLGMVDPFGNPQPLQDAYRKSCDFALEQVLTGATDYNTAIRRATKNIADQGVRVIDYESGIHTSLEAAVRRNIMGGLGLMQEQISRQNHDEMGANGWEISAHAASAPDHEPIQGKQYSDADFHALNNSLKRRIGTLNCGHAAFPIILGVSSPQYTERELKQYQSDNRNGVDYEGQHYTLYEATQKQRQIERGIRKQKQRILVDEATGDQDKRMTDQIRLRRLNEEYRRFSKAADLRTQPERAQVAGFGREQANRAISGAEQYYQKWSKEIGANRSMETLAKYYDVKYTDSPRYELLRQYARDVQTGWISPLSGFENYETLYGRIQNEIVGHDTSNGIEIKGQVPHFMQRVIGTAVDPEKLKNDLKIIRRSGVEVDDIKSALFNPERVDPIAVRNNGKRSVRFIGKACVVTVNPDSGELIQTNLRRKQNVQYE